jgi:hypothetical protein
LFKVDKSIDLTASIKIDLNERVVPIEVDELLEEQ